MSALEDYFQIVQKQLAEISSTQREKLTQATDWVAAALQNEKFVYTFGSGHSHTLAEEMFYRAGGLARSIPILDENLMVHKSASASTEWERKEGYALEVLKRYSLGAGDILFVVSNSGRNAVPIEMTMEASKRGAKVIAVSSAQHSNGFASRHSSGKNSRTSRISSSTIAASRVMQRLKFPVCNKRSRRLRPSRARSF